MLVKTLKTNKPAAFISFFVMAGLILILNLVFPLPTSASTNHPLFGSIASFFLAHTYWAILVLFGMAMLMSMGWNNLLTERGVFKNVTILPAFFLLLLTSVFGLSSIWISTFILLFVLNKLMSSFQQDRPYGLLFDSGFLIGLSALIYPSTILFFILCTVSSFIYTSISWRNFVIPFVGLLTPFLFGWSYAYYFEKLDLFASYYLSAFSWQWPLFDYSFELTVWSSLLIILFLLSIKELLDWLSMKSLRSRKAFILLFAYCVCSFFSLFLSPNSWKHILLFALPFTVLISNYFIFLQKKWWSESLFVLIVLSTIYLRLFFI